MRRQLLAVAAAAAAVAVSFVGTPLAHADEQGFLNELHRNGFSGMFVGGQHLSDGDAVAQGYMGCNALHTGQTPDQIYAQMNPGDLKAARVLIRAAQHNLCPDTL